MKNTSVIVILSSLIAVLGIALVFQGISYNNSEWIQLENSIAGVFGSEKNLKGDYYICGGAILIILGFVLIFKNIKNR